MRGALFENQIDEFENVFKHEHEYAIANAPLKPVLGRYATRPDDCQMSFGGQTSIQPMDPTAEIVPPAYIPIDAIPHTNDQDDRFGFSLSTSMATMFNRNPPGERVDALRKWAAEKREVAADRLAHVVAVRISPDYIVILTLEEIKKKKPENTLQEEKCWVRVIIPEPDRSRIVPYIGCNNCGKRVESECGESYTCKFCGKEKCIAMPRITFKFDACDDTDEMTFTAFTQECEVLFKQPATDIYTEITDLPRLQNHSWHSSSKLQKKLKEAGAAAETKQERDICALLANSITDDTAYAWKMFYSGETASLLSEESYETLKEAIKNAEDIFRIPPCKSPCSAPQASLSGKKRKGKGTKKCKHSSVHARQTKQPANKKIPFTKKGKAKISQVETSIEDDSDEYSPLPWNGMFLGDGSVVHGTKRYDMYCEGSDGYFYLRTVYAIIEDYASGGGTSGYLNVDDEI
ncbi:hypothetical protein BVRB_1g012620 [Beta vulgaris subsp. vulgaris]|nr:hypothetical protein BVRB_1g012620 [Beta vulgaris subsp. vulgaris]